MTLDEVISQLEAMGTEQNRKIYRRHGAGENQFGVSIANIRALAKTINRDQILADRLWRTGNQDARTLATLIADPKAMAADELETWAAGLDYYMVADMFSANVAGNHPAAGKKAEEWTASEQEYVAQAGWDLVGIIAIKDKSLPDEYFEAWLTKIERGIHAAQNRARHAMNGAVIAIGLRNELLRVKAEAVAARIGKVEVDHGETGCVTPDAVSYIEKAWARRRSA
jgi:3-methyladenine DNA glycosylase AlkD